MSSIPKSVIKKCLVDKCDQTEPNTDMPESHNMSMMQVDSGISPLAFCPLRATDFRAAGGESVQSDDSLSASSPLYRAQLVNSPSTAALLNEMAVPDAAVCASPAAYGGHLATGCGAYSNSPSAIVSSALCLKMEPGLAPGSSMGASGSGSITAATGGLSQFVLEVGRGGSLSSSYTESCADESPSGDIKSPSIGGGLFGDGNCNATLATGSMIGANSVIKGGSTRVQSVLGASTPVELASSCASDGIPKLEPDEQVMHGSSAEDEAYSEAGGELAGPSGARRKQQPPWHSCYRKDPLSPTAMASTPKSNLSSGSDAGSSSGTAYQDLKRVCLVCNDEASGYHYGVPSCEACKAFFKRTIQGNIEYSCPGFNKCEISKKCRKACQACRYKKCLSVGMLKEGVRMDRVRGGRQKYRRNPETNMPELHPPRKPATYKALHRLLELEKVFEQPDSASPEADPAEAADNEEEVKAEKAIGMISTGADRDIVLVISWAKQVPGFSTLTLQDQIKVLQVNWGEILLLMMLFRSVPFDGKHFVISKKEVLTSDDMRAMGAEDAVNLFSRVCARMTEMKLSQSEYVLLKCLALLNDVPVEDEQCMTKLRNNILDDLRLLCQQSHPSQANRAMNILLLLPLLRQSNIFASQYFYALKQDGHVYLHKLFAEMLEATVNQTNWVKTNPVKKWVPS